MANILIKKYYLENLGLPDDVEVEFDLTSERPAWIHVENKDFKPRFLTVVTPNESEIIYQRFTGNFYYPVDITIREDDEKKFYAKYAQLYDEFTSRNNTPMAQFLLDKAMALGLNKDSKILDLGAGTGIFSDLAAKNGFTNFTLVDISAAMLDVAKTKPNLKSCKFIEADVRKLKLQDNYDFIVSVMLFDAIKDKGLPEVLENLKQHLNNGGYFLIIEDKDREEYSKYFERIESENLPIHKDKLIKHYFIGKLL